MKSFKTVLTRYIRNLKLQYEDILSKSILNHLTRIQYEPIQTMIMLVLCVINLEFDDFAGPAMFWTHLNTQSKFNGLRRPNTAPAGVTQIVTRNRGNFSFRNHFTIHITYIIFFERLLYVLNIVRKCN